ncbi:MAG: hypothetical protein AMXMBFR64_44190 [Myxococcales bacterium]
MSLRRLAPLCALAMFIAGCSDSPPGGTTGDAGADEPADTGAADAGSGDGAAPLDAPGAGGHACSIAEDCAGLFPELLPCEVVVCGADGTCRVDALPDGSSCKDGLACTGPDFCIGGKCGGGPLNCEDGDPCTADSCDSKVGCVHVPADGGPCDDGNPCTEGDACASGTCTGPVSVAGCCTWDAECTDGDPCTEDSCVGHACAYTYGYAPCDDGNPCTLKDHCDGEGGCGGDLLTCDDGHPCTTDVCDPATGSCVASPAPDGTPCEDGNPCTTPDLCESGACVGQGSLCQCTSDADCAPFEDGDLCNGTLRCASFVCQVDPLSVIACNPTADTACVKAVCTAATGQCAPAPVPGQPPCDDQNPCTVDDSCVNGLCVGAAGSCDDGNECTFDGCSPVDGCVHVPHALPCDDGDACTANDQCGAGVCAGDAVPCDDGNPCTTDGCNPVAGCNTTPAVAPCDDGNPCTVGDTCAGGACVSGPNTCECVSHGDCADKEDGNLCNGTLRCEGGQCEVDPLTVVTCNTTGDTACAKTTCLAASGACVKAPLADGTKCSDLDSCTLGDACVAGSCVGTVASCDDANPCTTDGCDPAKGCVNTPNTQICNDGNPCTGNDKCSGGACSGVPIACDDGNPCTVDGCTPASGCTSTPAANGTPCNDGNVCTVLDVCAAGVCGGVPASCDDHNPCTADTCSNPAGCANKTVANGTPCDDGSSCSTGDTCQGGVCAGNPPSCDDGNPCTVDICDAVLGCTSKAAANGTACSDGDPCTGGDACDKGTCKGGGPICECQVTVDCAAKEDGNLCNGTLVCVANACKVDPATVVTCTAPGDPCKQSTCAPATGKCQIGAGPSGAPCDDGDACTTNDSCSAGTCGGLPKVCNDGNPCTADSCTGGACTTKPAFDGTLCADDGNSCTLDVCAAGACTHKGLADGVACADDGNVCTADACKAGTCAHTAINEGLPCQDDGNPCTYDRCAAGVCQHVSNDPAPVGSGQCFAVASITADTGTVSGSFSDCGAADQFTYKCQGAKCSTTGAIDTWPCADPSFLYSGANTGYEYAYAFVSPVDGVCTLIEYEEGIKLSGGGLFGVLDWFILSGGACGAGACFDYMWENKTSDPVCGGKTCSYKSFPVTAGQSFTFVADVFDGVNSHEGYTVPKGWTIEVRCDASKKLLLNEDFTDGQCSGCTQSVTAGPTCKSFGWHEIGGFSTMVTAMYLGQLQNNTLLGYDCGATTATLTFPSVALPSNATSCTLSFDWFASLDPANDGDCVNDIVTVMLKVGGGAAQPVAGKPCVPLMSGSNPIGSSSQPNALTMSYDITASKGTTVTASLAWSANATANNGLGVIIDNVKISCSVP